jgi:serine/threonine protein kinase
MDNYETIRKLGQGTCAAHHRPCPRAAVGSRALSPLPADGSVFLTRQKSSGRQCVMKRMQLSTLNEKERRAALQEAQLLQQLTHPNVVAYVDMHATRSKLFLFMQYCDGGDLEQRINAHKKEGTWVPESQLLDWFVQMALALQYLHDSRSAPPPTAHRPPPTH